MDPKMKMALIEELLKHLTSRDDEDLKGSLKPKVTAIEMSAKPEDEGDEMPLDGMEKGGDDDMSSDDLDQLLQHYSGIKG
jgi:hypothetical protein